ncbi:hypothetical protein [Paramagnetospirillum marisnigri]|nr:hypothetical protein [Paramagnetospirillum marisnigri]
MTQKVPDEVRQSRYIIVGMAVILIILLGSLAYGAIKSFTPPG